MARFWSWVSCEFSLIPDGAAAQLCPWMRQLGAADAAESALVRGAGGVPLGTTDPQYAPGEGGAEVLMRPFRIWAKGVLDAAGGAANVRLSELDFTFVIKRKSRTESEAMIDEVKFQFAAWDDQQAQGSPDPLVSTMGLLITDISRNGVRL